MGNSITSVLFDKLVQFSIGFTIFTVHNLKIIITVTVL